MQPDIETDLQRTRAEMAARSRLNILQYRSRDNCYGLRVCRQRDIGHSQFLSVNLKDQKDL
jgi:hypothetical protein